VATKTRPTLDEFLARPETEPPSEFVCGEVVQKMAPSWYHSRLAARLAQLLGNYLDETGEGFVSAESRHAHRGEQRAYLPDVEVILAQRLPADREALLRGPIEIPPDFAIEILSPDDSTGRVLDKVDFYLRTGVQLVWLVDPELETVTVYRPGEQPSTERAPAALDATPVLRGFTLDLDAFFATLHPAGSD
jgi:Uma2 family endonuclease